MGASGIWLITVSKSILILLVALGYFFYWLITYLDKCINKFVIRTDVFEKVHSNLEEVKARKGKIILFTDKDGKAASDNLTKTVF